MTQDNATTDTLLTSFATWLKSRGRSAHSLRAYRSDVGQFATWFHQHTQEPFTLAAVTDQDVAGLARPPVSGPQRHARDREPEAGRALDLLPLGKRS